MESRFGVSIKWLSVTCFEIRCGDVTVVSDPFVTDCESTALTWEAIEKCDILCLSHAHFDHITDIPRLVEKYQPLLLCGEQTAMPLAKWLNYTSSRIYPMYPDAELDFDTVKIRALYGRHADLGKGLNDLCASLAKYRPCVEDQAVNGLQAIGSLEYRNFLLTFPNGTTVLLWGNDPTPEQKNICKALKPDIAIVQRSGDLEEIKKKAAFAAEIGCKVLIPHHMDFPSVIPPETVQIFQDEFLRLVPKGVFISPTHGEWIDL
ncbi:MAG: MBL fold metallo-hydrolase [Clostridia bacterium]|nr:MBL fold metallo-hydrolase [Clostridia bacterium]